MPAQRRSGEETCSAGPTGGRKELYISLKADLSHHKTYFEAAEVFKKKADLEARLNRRREGHHLRAQEPGDGLERASSP